MARSTRRSSTEERQRYWLEVGGSIPLRRAIFSNTVCPTSVVPTSDRNASNSDAVPVRRHSQRGIPTDCQRDVTSEAKPKWLINKRVFKLKIQ